MADLLTIAETAERLMTAGLSPATIRQRLATLRSAASGMLVAPGTLTPVDPEYVITERGLRPYRRPESGA